MQFLNPAPRGRGTTVGAALGAVLVLAQVSQSPIAPLRTAPIEKFTVNPGHRDWAPTTITGTTILGGNSSNRGGLFAVDMITGKVKWASRPAGLGSGNPWVGSAPVVSGDVVLTIMNSTLVGLSLATGKEIWRGPVAKQSATVAAGSGVAYVLGDNGIFYALDAATGRERWKVGFRPAGSCHALPVVHEGTVYVSIMIQVRPADANRAAEGSEHLFALDAQTGQERWRYPAAGSGSACLEQPVVTAGTFFGVMSQALHAVDLTTGRDRWTPVRVRQLVEGRLRGVAIEGLVEAGSLLVGVTPGALVAFDKATGKTAWEVAGQYNVGFPATAVAGRVLYFQGHPGAEPAGQDRIVYVGGRPVTRVPVLPLGRLNALDLDTRAVLWSFSRPTAEANWSFGFVSPVEGGLWVSSYQALVKLQ